MPPSTEETRQVANAGQQTGTTRRASAKHVIVTADDFGLDVAVNEAVERAFRDGILTTASLMVGAPAAADAVARARRMPGLHVGLHCTLVDGRSVLPPEAIPDLVTPDGEFRAGQFGPGVRFFFLPRVRRQLAAEIRAQFDAFRATGLELDHVNAHKHMHVHPTVLALILEIGRDHGLRAVRLPYEPRNQSGPGEARTSGTSGTSGMSSTFGNIAGAIVELRRIVAAGLLAPWLALLRRRIRRAGVRHNDYLFGLSNTGAWNEAALLELLRRLPDGVSELYFHPAAARTTELVRRMPDYRQEDELAALLSPAVRTAFDRAGYQRMSFGELQRTPD